MPSHTRFPIASLVAALILALPLPAGAADLPACVIDFDTGSVCPDVATVCGASFQGGVGCSDLNFPTCRTTGDRYFRINSSLTILLDQDLTSLSIDFSAVGTGSGTMSFFDEAGKKVSGTVVVNGQPQSVTFLRTIGNCKYGEPQETQTIDFNAGVRRIQVTTVGETALDTFHINPLAPIPTMPASWSMVKARYR